jgi:hypothetical protein
MENSFQTSFIPKKPMTMTARPFAKEPRSLFFYIALFLFIVSLLASGGLFLYKAYLNNQKDISSKSLSEVRGSFEKATIEELDLYDKRTNIITELLNKHIVLTPLFKLLEENTIPSIQYTNFEQKEIGGSYKVTINGLATDYRAIAMQADVFNTPKGQMLENVVFSNLEKTKNNNVSFDLEFNVNPSLLYYENNGLNQNLSNN